MPSLLTVFLSTPFHKLPSVKPYSILMTLRRTVLNDGDESSFDLSRPSSPWLCKTQIREQMCHETHFQYEFSILGHFGQSGLQRKKIQTAISMLLLRTVYLCFHGQKVFILFFLNIVVSALKSYIKWSYTIYNFVFQNLIMNFK